MQIWSSRPAAGTLNDERTAAPGKESRLRDVMDACGWLEPRFSGIYWICLGTREAQYTREMAQTPKAPQPQRADESYARAVGCVGNSRLFIPALFLRVP